MDYKKLSPPRESNRRGRGETLSFFIGKNRAVLAVEVAVEVAIKCLIDKGDWQLKWQNGIKKVYVKWKQIVLEKIV